MASIFSGIRRPKLGTDASDVGLTHAFNSESAYTLGKTGRELEAALARVALSRAEGNGTADTRVLYECAHVVWKYFVQREACGVYRHDPVIELYQIPGDVLSKVGAGPQTSVAN